MIRAVDPHSFFTDPDPAAFLSANPDPEGKMNADPDPQPCSYGLIHCVLLIYELFILSSFD